MALPHFEDFKPTEHPVPFQAGVNSPLGSTVQLGASGAGFLLFMGAEGCREILATNILVTPADPKSDSSHGAALLTLPFANSKSFSMQTKSKSKTKRRSLLPRPVVINVPPIETQRTQRRAKPSPASPVRRPAPDPKQEAQWILWTDELADIVLRPVSPTNEDVDTEDPAAEKETLAQDTERARVWEIVVLLAIEGMRESDRRAWFRDQCMQEKRELQEQRDRQGNMLDCVEYFSDWSGPEEYIDYDMKDPKERAVAADRRAAGIGPIMGGSQEVVRALKKSRRDKADELTQHCELEPAYKPPTPSAHEVRETDPDALHRKRLVVDLDRMRCKSVLRRLPGQQLFIPLLPGSRTVSPATASLTTTPRAKPAIDPSSMAGIPAFYREPDWSEASDNNEYDPASPLPYCPRWNISTQRLDAIWTAATTTTPETLAAREKEQAQIAANCAQAWRAQKKRAMAEQSAVGNYLKYIFLKEFTMGLGAMISTGNQQFLIHDLQQWKLLHRLGKSISVLACRQTTKIGTLTLTVSWVATGTEVRFVHTFQESLAYLGVGEEDDRHFWVVDGDATIH
ncbi:hypothetical protein DFH08DRAFT_798340 [Mycena albidolilacea]|uniref:Uncharacterized protein n=1 Tax=Mycena albidolilacea TaxID=1033008 RepID=A0AAD7F2V6_9AGAR|nr:hypothetical protein DFH08DRAFT_798340 [Mycena albidolilacea]